MDQQSKAFKKVKKKMTGELFHGNRMKLNIFFWKDLTYLFPMYTFSTP